MIQPASPPSLRDVARHYDELDFFYRHVWGEHVHHGIWNDERDRTSVEEATERLLVLASIPLGIRKGDRVVDVGCGYGGGSRWLARTYGAAVTGLTISEAQAEAAHHFSEGQEERVEFKVEDWLTNSLPDSHFHAAIAIESLAHMSDKGAFFRQLARTLEPGGKAAVACWLTACDPTRLEQGLLRKICEEGRLPGMGTVDDYLRLAGEAGLRVLAHRDLTLEVERTWWIIARRVLAGLFTNPRYLRFLCSRAFREKIFVLTLPRLMLAYRTGAMRYGLIWLQKPGPSRSPSAPQP